MTSYKSQYVLVLVAIASLAGPATALDKQTQRLLSTRIPAPLGMPAPDTAAQRVAALSPATRYVNVERGETIKFVSNGKTFNWFFDTVGAPTFDLAAIAPKDANVKDVTVYVRHGQFNNPN